MMDFDEIKQILALVRKDGNGPAGLAMANPAAAPAMVPAAAAAASPQSPVPATTPTDPAADPDDELELAVVTSPIVGTFYRASEPGARPFVEVGDVVRKNQVLCIIEAMKLMNEIDSEYEGELVKVFVENGQPVQYGERLFAIRAK
jgi:acetyl-CoA carboxylase biotin carboxyl carrier protein